MITAITIRNFRCYRDIRVEGCRTLNVIVGDNGVGKTALLEALFLTLGTSAEVGIRLRQHRGADGNFNAVPDAIENAIWGDLFFADDPDSAISIELEGDGAYARSLVISKGQAEALLPLSGGTPVATNGSMEFAWRTSSGQEYTMRPSVTPSGIAMQGLAPEGASSSHFPAGSPVSSIEAASRFSELSKIGRHTSFINVIEREYPWISNIGIEVSAGSPALFASIDGLNSKLPITSISGGISRSIAFMLAIAHKRGAVVSIDEIENGIYFKHHAATWRGMIHLARENSAQLFVTTHSEESIRALVDVMGSDTSDVTLWRVERSAIQPTIRQFGGATLRAGVLAGGELR